MSLAENKRETPYIWMFPSILLHLLLQTGHVLHSFPPTSHGHILVVGIVVGIGNIYVEEVVVVVLI